MKKNTLMTPETIKEIESLIPDHGEALIRWGAQLHRDGIVKGGIGAVIGMAIGLIAVSVKDSWKKIDNNEEEEES
ncbi:hypothetical protein [Blautia glucerasea]|uniref:hypothetical protein n=1 Tax=Blautia glucerasea TaxID=536633 RepID=UPI001570C71D|nr:hypothetical protein [Blautia glucerasea]NSJ25474.1 hypothetical protein [Blautia glucerasea]